MDERTFYPYSFDEAKRNSCIDLYKESLQANTDCKNAIENILKENYNGTTLEKGSAKEVLDKYGIDRVNYVISATLQRKSTDGRFSADNMNLAKETFIPEDKNNRDFLVNAHSGLLNVFVNQFHDELKLLNLWDKSQVNSTDNLNFESKVMVVSPTALKENFRTRENQLVFCAYGAGCMPEKTGKMVYGTFLKDGEKAQFQRQDFLGEAKDEFLSNFEKSLKSELLIVSKSETKEEDKPKKRESVLGRLNEKKSEIANKKDDQKETNTKEGER
ncbi:MAG: DUF3849 domain-containing protein [Lachnospirales bacterium]